jgi:hypothetical protein
LAGVDWKIITTASAWRHLEVYLWPEIHKWAKRIRWDKLGRKPLDERSELLSLNIKLRHGSAFAVASSNPELIEGVHADSVLYVFDESKAISAGTFEAAEGAFSGADPKGGLPEAFALACSTPGEPNGTFYDIHARHVTLGEAIAAGRVAEGWADQRKKQWGENSAAYNNRVLGEFYSSDEDGVIPLGWIEAANERWRAWDEAGRPEAFGRRAVGVDVARSGTDKTVMAILDGHIVTELRHTSRADNRSCARHPRRQPGPASDRGRHRRRRRCRGSPARAEDHRRRLQCERRNDPQGSLGRVGLCECAIRRVVEPARAPRPVARRGTRPAA